MRCTPNAAHVPILLAVLFGIWTVPALAQTSSGTDNSLDDRAILYTQETLASPPLPSDSIDARLKALEDERQTGEFRRIMQELEALAEQHPEHGGILWRLARTRTDVAERTADDEERKALCRKALSEAEQAVDLLPNSSNAHLAKAVAAGRLGMVSGTRRQVELSRTVREYVDLAIALDPDNDLAYHVRGRWHYEVAQLGFFARRVVNLVYGGLPEASLEEARADYRTALDLEERLVHHFELGRTLLEMNRPGPAREHLRRAITMPQRDVTDPIYKERARRLLQEMDRS